MKPTLWSRFLMAALLVGAGVAGAAVKDKATVPQSDAELTKQIRHEVLMYPNFSIWDDVNFRVDQGRVELLGAVNQLYKKSDLGKIVQSVPGVTSVANDLKVLPLSPMDNRLRIQVARAIYGDPTFTRYRLEAVGPIHIIVENGHVTLTGVVSNDFEKNIAGVRASGAGLAFGPVVNNLQVEHPSKKG